MTVDRLRRLITWLGFIGFVATIALPGLALLIRALTSGEWSDAQLLPSARQSTLILRTVGLSAAAVALSIILSWPGAFLIGRSGRVANAPWFVAIIVTPLLLPPMTLAFGWQRFLGGHQWFPADWSPLVRCVWVWASWLWPIHALILGAGWSRVGRGAFEAALIDSSAPTAFLRAVLPSLSKYVFVSALIGFVLCLGEYSVPHANGLVVTATELLAVSQIAQTDGIRYIFQLAGPTLACIAVGVVFLWRLWPFQTTTVVEYGRTSSTRKHFIIRTLVGIVVLTTVGIPMAVLAVDAARDRAWFHAIRTYSGQLMGSVLTCLTAGVVATIVGIFAVTRMRWKRTAVTLTLITGILPGAIIGVAVLAAYKPAGAIFEWPPLDRWGWWLYNNPTIVVIGLAARFAWIGTLAAWLALRTRSPDAHAQAMVDGIDEPLIPFAVHLREQWATLLCGTFIATSMTMADLPVSSLLEVPTQHMIAKIVVEKFHRFETGMMASLSLWMVACVIPGAILVGTALRRRTD